MNRIYRERTISDIPRPEFDVQLALDHFEIVLKKAERAEPDEGVLTEALLIVTQRWAADDPISRDEQKVREIGEKLWNIGGMGAMTGAYRAAAARNPAAKIVAGYWDGVGDWQW